MLDIGILRNLPAINPLDDFNFTFDHFYQYVKRAAGAQNDQLIQIRAAAEPLDFSDKHPWYSYYSYLLKVDTAIVPQPITEKSTAEAVGMSSGQLSYEYGRFLAEAVRLVELQELPPETNEQIALLETKSDNIRTRINKYAMEDALAWPAYANAMGFAVGDMTAFTQWWTNYGNANRINRLAEDLDLTDGQIESMRLDRFKDADQEEIFKAFTSFRNVGSRLRWPRHPDSMYREGVPFTPDYLARLPFGDTALFADRHYFFIQGTSLTQLISSGLGSFTETLTQSSQSTESITKDWNASASGSYAWFKVSVNASEHTSIKTDMSNTQKVTVSCKSLQKLPYDAAPWFKPTIFNNSYIKKNPRKFQRYFGKGGTLRYYPAALIVARGVKLQFESSQNYSYDYKNTFSAQGSASINVWGISFGANGGYSSTRAQQTIESQGHTLTLDDGETNFRVIGYILNTVNILDQALYGDLDKSLEEARAQDGSIGLGN